MVAKLLWLVGILSMTGTEVFAQVEQLGIDPNPVPAMSTWGLVIFGLSVLTAANILLLSRKKFLV